MGIGYWMWPDLLTDANSKIEKWKKNKTHTHARARMFIWKIQGKLSCDTKIETRSRCKWDKNRWHLYTCHHSSISVESQDTTSENIGQITMNVKILVCKSPSLSVCVCVCVCVCVRACVPELPIHQRRKTCQPGHHFHSLDSFASRYWWQFVRQLRQPTRPKVKDTLFTPRHTLPPRRTLRLRLPSTPALPSTSRLLRVPSTTLKPRKAKDWKEKASSKASSRVSLKDLKALKDPKDSKDWKDPKDLKDWKDLKERKVITFLLPFITLPLPFTALPLLSPPITNRLIIK